jgi:hypothetical protein
MPKKSVVDTKDAVCEMCLRNPAKVDVVVPMGLGEQFGWAYCEMSLCAVCVDSMPNLTIK